MLGRRLNSKSGVGWVVDGIDWVGYRHWATYKLIRKRALKRLKRRSRGGCSLETTMAYLSHAKETASLRRVAGILWARNREQHWNPVRTLTAQDAYMTMTWSLPDFNASKIQGKRLR